MKTKGTQLETGKNNTKKTSWPNIYKLPINIQISQQLPINGL